jgi:hypothetical protein
MFQIILALSQLITFFLAVIHQQEAGGEKLAKFFQNVIWVNSSILLGHINEW